MSILSRHLLNIGSKLDQILPAQPCQLCGAMSRNGTWCRDCDASLPILGIAHCPICALPSPQGTTCGKCLTKRPLFDRTIAAYAYTFPMDKLIQSLKYNAQLQLAGMLTTRLAQRIEYMPDCIVPMPLHPARLRERGFNQSPSAKAGYPAFAGRLQTGAQHSPAIDTEMEGAHEEHAERFFLHPGLFRQACRHCG